MNFENTKAKKQVFAEAGLRFNPPFRDRDWWRRYKAHVSGQCFVGADAFKSALAKEAGAV